VKEFIANKISKSEFLKLNEDDLMFITNPGRMGDEDGATFIIKHGNDFSIYRVDGWMYPREDGENITLEDASKQFPKWRETWKHSAEKEYKGKYKYIYMGFGNGLCVDNSIYSEFEPYLYKLVEEQLEKSGEGDRENLRYSVIFNSWEQAFIDMVNETRKENSPIF
jgi:hypothetical protein